MRMLYPQTMDFFLCAVTDAGVEPFLQELERIEPLSGHSFRTSLYAIDIAGDLAFSEQEILELGRSALVHDIGKYGMPYYIFSRATALEPKQKEIARTHVRLGVEKLKKSGLLAEARNIGGHHEYQHDSYPRKTRRGYNKISEVLAVADKLDALNSPRPYHRKYRHDEIAGILRNIFTGNPAYVDIALKRA